MSYAALADVRGVLAKDPFNAAANAASLDDDQIQLALDDATDQIDGAIGFTYPTPFSTPYPRLVSQICRDIAAYLADLTYRGSKDYGNNDPVVLRYQRALLNLKGLTDGSSRLVDWPPAGDTVDQPSTEAGSVVGPAGGYNSSSVTVPDLVNGLHTTADPFLGFPRQWAAWDSGQGWDGL